jgi:hypothetical protein
VILRRFRSGRTFLGLAAFISVAIAGKSRRETRAPSRLIANEKAQEKLTWAFSETMV